MQDIHFGLKKGPKSSNAAHVVYPLHVVPAIMARSTRGTISYTNFGVGGEGRIRTSEGFAGRFTVCSLWPLGNLSTSLKTPEASQLRKA